MTHASSAPSGALPAPSVNNQMIALVHLLARGAAQADFAARFNSKVGEASHD